MRSVLNDYDSVVHGAIMPPGSFSKHRGCRLMLTLTYNPRKCCTSTSAGKESLTAEEILKVTQNDAWRCDHFSGAENQDASLRPASGSGFNGAFFKLSVGALMIRIVVLVYFTLSI